MGPVCIQKKQSNRLAATKSISFFFFVNVESSPLLFAGNETAINVGRVESRSDVVSFFIPNPTLDIKVTQRGTQKPLCATVEQVGIDIKITDCQMPKPA